MSERPIQRIEGKLTDEQKRRHERIRRRVAQDRPRLDHEARVKKAELLALRDALGALKREREARGLSIGEVARRSGIDKSALAKMEKNPHANPTVTTLTRIADAIGVELAITFRAA